MRGKGIRICRVKLEEEEDSLRIRMRRRIKKVIRISRGDPSFARRKSECIWSKNNPLKTLQYCRDGIDWGFHVGWMADWLITLFQFVGNDQSIDRSINRCKWSNLSRSTSLTRGKASWCKKDFRGRWWIRIISGNTRRGSGRRTTSSSSSLNAMTSLMRRIEIRISPTCPSTTKWESSRISSRWFLRKLFLNRLIYWRRRC